jgi:proline iminopeptidase
MDHRGFGINSGPVSDSMFSLGKIVEDFETMRRHQDLDRFAIIGHSGHAYMALEYAKQYPQHVSHVVMIAQSPDSTAASFASADLYLEESVCPDRKALLAQSMQQLEEDIKKDPARKFVAYSIRSAPRTWYDYRFNPERLWEGVDLVPEMFDHVWGKLFRELDITVGLDSFRVPVLVMLGRYDYWNPPALWDTVRKHFYDLTIRVFEQSGHHPQLEEPALFDAELIRWLKSNQNAV